MASAGDIHSAFVDRRDITQGRTGSMPMPTDNTELLQSLVRELRAVMLQPNVQEELIFMNPGMMQPGTHIEPAPGINRQVVIRTAVPPNNLSIPVAGAIVYQDNPNRFGGVIVNTGTNPLLLVLGVDLSNNAGIPQGGAAQAGYGSLWLSSAGGSWDFRLSDIVWGGSIFGFGLGGTTTIVGAEI